MKQKIDNLISNLIIIAAVAFMVLVGISMIQAKRTGSEVFICGYKPIYIMTGSMEPYMMTDSLCMTKKVDSLDELKVGDVITFTVYDEASQRNLRISHRIIEIADDGTIQTQGDNNNAPDSFTLTIDNVQAKIIGVWNGFANITHFLESKYGIPTVIGFALAIVLGCVAVKCLKPEPKTNKEETKAEN